MAFATLPADISRQIYNMTMSVKDTDNRAGIVSTIWKIMDFIPTSRVLYNVVPIFEGSSTDMHITSFKVDKIGQSHGVVTTIMDFWIGDGEFVVQYNDYTCDGSDPDVDVCMFIVNKNSKYADLAAEAFLLYFEKGLVY